MNIAVHPGSLIKTTGPHEENCEQVRPIIANPADLKEELRWEDDGGALLQVAKSRATSFPGKARSAMCGIAEPVAGNSDDEARRGRKLTWLQYAGKRSFQEKIKPDHALAKFAVLLGRCKKTVQPTGKAA